MNIKQYLKKVGITQKDFADRIGLSRPTLDAYIELYENGKDIPKERYKLIFYALFAGEPLSLEEFWKRLKNVENLLERDERYELSELEPIAADFVSSLLRNMKKDMLQDEWNKDVYIFINILISNYRRNVILKRLAEYFIYLNDFNPIEDIEDGQKPYFASFFKTFSTLQNDSETYSHNDYNAFLDRCTEIHKKKESEAKLRDEKMKKMIQSLIDKNREKGIELSEEEIITEAIDRFKTDGG